MFDSIKGMVQDSVASVGRGTSGSRRAAGKPTRAKNVKTAVYKRQDWVQPAAKLKQQKAASVAPLKPRSPKRPVGFDAKHTMGAPIPSAQKYPSPMGMFDGPVDDGMYHGRDTFGGYGNPTTGNQPGFSAQPEVDPRLHAMVSMLAGMFAAPQAGSGAMAPFMRGPEQAGQGDEILGGYSYTG